MQKFVVVCLINDYSYFSYFEKYINVNTKNASWLI